MNKQNKIIIGLLENWSLRRRFLTFITIFTIEWGFLDPLFAMFGESSPLSFLGPWRYLGMVVIAGLLVLALEVVEKRRFKGQLSLVSFEIVLLESGARYKIVAPEDMRAEEFISSFIKDISKNAPSNSFLARADIYNNSLVICKENGVFEECDSSKSLKENGVVNGMVCRIQGKIKIEQANAYYQPVHNVLSLAKKQEFERRSSQYQFLYSLIGLLFGLLICVIGFYIFITGLVGSKSWTAIMTGVESPVADMIFGLGLIIAGLFTVFLTRYDKKITLPESEAHEEDIQGKIPFSYTLIHDPIKVISSIKDIVDESIAESKTVTWDSLFPAVSNQLENLASLRSYYGKYFRKLIPLVSALDRATISEGAGLINDFFCKTALNYILDAWYTSYVMKDYILDLYRLFESHGAEIERIQLNFKYMVNTWNEIDETVGEYKFLNVEDLKRILRNGD